MCTIRHFLSTLSLRRATSIETLRTVSVKIFYPRSPCGERLAESTSESDGRVFSIHALLAESDRQAFFYTASHTFFYPRSPCGERRIYLSVVAYSYYFSIHALLAESDHVGRRKLKKIQFSIHALLAESDDDNSTMVISNYIFLSTLSLRRATSMETFCQVISAFSIHALLAESDGAISQLQCVLGIFYPRSPCGERLS